MKIIYSENSSQIMEQFFIPYFLRADSETGLDFSNKERKVLENVLPIMEELRQLLLPYKEKIERYYLMGYGLSFLHSVYLDMMNGGVEVSNTEDVHAKCLCLTEEEIREHLKILLNTEWDRMDKNTDFEELLDLSTAKPETKWHFSQFYRKPIESIQELVQLSRELISLYQPYFEQGRTERQAYAQTFSLPDFIEQVPILSHYSWEFAVEEEIFLYITSPWLVTLQTYETRSGSKPLHCFIVSCRIEHILGEKEELDTEEFAAVLKVISDATRYNILVELTKPHAKSKDIAKDLDITGAAVSFHTQKLLNAQLLLLNREDKYVKYDVNKNLLQAVITKLQDDFELGNEQ